MSTAWPALAERERVDLTVAGPELPLDRGIADLFAARGLRLFGPSRAAAQLECSKVFAKHFMARHGIPTARFRVCTRADEARRVVASGELGFPVVVKADGLAAGKGVVVAADEAEARRRDPRRDGGPAVWRGRRARRARRVHGRARSFVLRALRRHPRGSADDGAGPQAHLRRRRRPEYRRHGRLRAEPAASTTPCRRGSCARSSSRSCAGMRADGHPYRGFLYAGLMMTLRWPAGHRVQRPVRRSRSAGRHPDAGR